MPVKLYRGDTWQRSWIIRDAAGSPIDLTGAAARLHVRDAQGVLVMSASTADGRLVIQPTAGRVDMLMPHAMTGASPGAYRYDLEITHASGVRRTYEQDTLVILEDISRD